MKRRQTDSNSMIEIIEFGLIHEDEDDSDKRIHRIQKSGAERRTNPLSHIDIVGSCLGRILNRQSDANHISLVYLSASENLPSRVRFWETFTAQFNRLTPALVDTVSTFSLLISIQDSLELQNSWNELVMSFPAELTNAVSAVDLRALALLYRELTVECVLFMLGERGFPAIVSDLRRLMTH